MKRTSRFSTLLILLIVLGAGACKKQSSVDMPSSVVSAYEAFSEDSYNFSTFKYLIDRAGQANLLREGNYTIFAPTNSAFSAAGYTTAAIQALSGDSVLRLLRNHLVEGKIESNGLTQGLQLTTLNGDKLLVQRLGNDLYLDGANITNTNATLSNGVFHVINKVLAKRSSLLDRLSTYAIGTTNAQFTILVAAIARASQGSTDFTALLSDPAANYTFFAPNNGAFIDGGYASVAAVTAAVPDTLGRLLRRHLVTGRLLTTDFDSSKSQTTLGGPLVYFDKLKPGNTTYSYANGLLISGGSSNMLGGNNGVIHAVSRFLPVPLTVTTLARIQADTSLTYFNAALVKASTGGTDFVKMLSDPAGSYTVFAVNNAGFRAAGYATAAAVSNESAPTLEKILRLHTLNKRINNINIAENGTVQSLLTTDTGTPVSLTFTLNGGFKVKGASNVNTIPVIMPNLTTTNGLLNIIGSVLTP